MEEDEKKFDDIPEDKKKAYITLITGVMTQQVDNSESRLRVNKEKLKNSIFTSVVRKTNSIKQAEHEVELVEFIGNFVIANRERYINLSTNARDRRILEDMANIGFIQDATPKSSKGGEQPTTGQEIQSQGAVEDMSTTTGDKKDSLQNGVLEVEQITGGPGKKQNRAKVIPIEKARRYLENKKLDITTEAPEQQAPLESQEIAQPIPPSDLGNLNRPGLLLTDKKTGKKDIHYGRYSEDRRLTHRYRLDGREMQLTKIGRLAYDTAFSMRKDIEEYLVETSEGSAEVFTAGLDISKIVDEPQYGILVFDQLFSTENMHIKNGNGYVGSIVASKEKGKYEINYSDEEYTAVVELKKRLAQIKARETDMEDRG